MYVTVNDIKCMQVFT